MPAIEALLAGRNLTADSRQVTPGAVFLAFPGEAGDGRNYIGDAIRRGASAVIWHADEEGDPQRPLPFAWQPEWAVPNLALPELALQVGIIAAHHLGEPSRDMWVMGVTGTNGKTSCAHWLAQAFNRLGQKAALLGTLGYGFLGHLETASHTTPDAVRLQGLIAQYRQQQATHLAMEVSSHGLVQGRVHGVTFDVALFTNLTRDHLDYHGSMEAYGEAKARLFDWETLTAAVINTDDLFGSGLLAGVPSSLGLSYGFESGDLRGSNLQLSLEGLRFDVSSAWGEGEIVSPLVGRFNAYNLLGCLGVLLRSGVSLADALAVLSEIKPATGRMQRLGSAEQPAVMIDYAHTPDALEKALSTLREVMPDGKRLYCVFGCGGDRDRGKRPMMGRIACEYADTVIVTNDNPRREDPRRIINDILKGVAGAASKASNRGDYSVESDRARAIESVIEVAVQGDIVLIAGKGHETYQDIGGNKLPFSDAKVAQLALNRWKQ